MLITKKVLLLTLLLGFALRTFQLGHDSLWNDEAEVALVAVTLTIREALSGSLAAHLVMPLEYLTIWLTAKISVDEFCLRFLSVGWGMLTLAVCYRLFARLTEQRVAVLAVLFLALSWVDQKSSPQYNRQNHRVFQLARENFFDCRNAPIQ